MKPTPSYDFDIYDIFVPHYSLGPSFSAMSKKRKILNTHNRTHTRRTKIPRNAKQCFITPASGCLLWFLLLFRFCVTVDGKLDHVLQHKSSELQTDLAFTETKASWCMNLQISSGTSHSQLLNLLNASLMMFRSGDRRRCLKSICCLQNHSVFIWKT